MPGSVSWNQEEVLAASVRRFQTELPGKAGRYTRNVPPYVVSCGFRTDEAPRLTAVSSGAGAERDRLAENLIG